MTRWVLVVVAATLGWPLLGPASAVAQTQPDDRLAPYEGRLIREVRLLRRVGKDTPPESLDQATEGLVRNQIRSAAGAPFNPAASRGDITRLNRLARFRTVSATVEPLSDGSIILTYLFQEQPIIIDVQVVGNRKLNDDQIGAEINILADTPIDQFQIDRASRRIEELYRAKGYYLARVTVDQEELKKTGILLFRVREGQRVRVTDLRFEGNRAFTPRELKSSLKTKKAGLLDKGRLDDETLSQDVDGLIRFYKDHGYLDIRADRHVLLAPNGKEAIVTYIIDEGPRYTLRRVDVFYPALAELYPTVREATAHAGPGQSVLVLDEKNVAVYRMGRFTPEQIAGLMSIKPGDVYAADKLDASVRAVTTAYGKLGYTEARVERVELRDLSEPVVDLRLVVVEGKQALTGQVIISGNEVTRHEVIRRHVRVKPDRPLDSTAIADTKRRLENTRLFAPQSVKVTVQDPDPSEPSYRDVLVEIEEHTTGSFNFGAAVNSDAGVVGQISLEERNFDITDTPDSFSELIRGRSFRGAGQTFKIALMPGDRVQTYSVSLSEPHLMDSDYIGSGQASFRRRLFTDYDEERLTGTIGFGRRFGTRWEGALNIRAESVKLQNIAEDAPNDVFDVQDRNLLTGVGLSLTRTTLDRRFRPSRGARTELGVLQVGILGGDFNFTRFRAKHIVYLKLHETFLGQQTILSFETRASYIPQGPDEVPIYERLYLGGRSFRGFGFRGISPIGIRHDTQTPGDDHVGGTWSFFLGAQIQQPIWKDNVSIVGFIDSGTVTNDIGFENYRVSVGTGIRVYLPQLSPAPLAFDFGFPIAKEPNDDTRLLTFTIDVPF